MGASARARPPALPALRAARRRWEDELGSALELPVEVRFNRARSEPVRWCWEGAPRRVALRLHEGFAQAPDEVRAAMAAWIRSGRRARRASARLDLFIAERISTLPVRERRPRLCPRGATHDLERLSARLLALHFRADFDAERARPAVTWGRRARSRTRGSLRLGSYDPGAHLVRIHPVLDREAVPDWFVAYVLFHELLHAALPPCPGPDGRWIHHGAEFRRRERAYPDYQRALRWEEINLRRLVRAARSGRHELAAREAPARAEAPSSAERLERTEGLTRFLQGLLFDEPATRARQ